MEQIDLMVLRTLRDWTHLGKRTLLATVVRTWGSSPRPIGSLMALSEDGQRVGSVSGGCIEDDLAYRYSRAIEENTIPERPPELVKYGVTADEAQRFGLPCGGSLELLLEFNPELPALNELLGWLDQGLLARRTVDCRSGQLRQSVTQRPEPLDFQPERLSYTLGPSYRLLLIGAGALSEYLATMALFNGFRVAVCDPHLQYMGTALAPEVEIITAMPDDAVQAFRPDSRTAIVALSHDPKLDDLALLVALDSPAFYIGAIGSRRNTAKRRERLTEHFGLSDACLNQLKAPVGIHIGSKTPAEIAVSIMAEIIAIKNGVSLPREMSVAEGKQLTELSR